LTEHDPRRWHVLTSAAVPLRPPARRPSPRRAAGRPSSWRWSRSAGARLLGGAACGYVARAGSSQDRPLRSGR